MELISREEVVKIINEIREYLEWEYDDDSDGDFYCDTEKLLQRIKELPSQWIEINDVTFGKVYQNSFITFLSTDTFDAVKNKLSRLKGKWLRKEYYFDEWVDECSVCGEAYTMIEGTAQQNGYNYCPNCGAEMESE